MFAPVDRFFLDDEKVVHRAHKHWIVFYQPVLWLCVSFLLLMQTAELQKLAIISLSLTLALGIYSIVNFYISEMVLTDFRILVQLGIIRRTNIEVVLWHVLSIDIQQSFMGKFLNYGRIEICDINYNCFAMKRLADPFKFKKAIEHEISLYFDTVFEEKNAVLAEEEKKKKEDKSYKPKKTVIEA